MLDGLKKEKFKKFKWEEKHILNGLCCVGFWAVYWVWTQRLMNFFFFFIAKLP